MDRLTMQSRDVVGSNVEKIAALFPQCVTERKISTQCGGLRSCPEQSVGRDGTPGGFDSQNLYIDGDNLNVLKVLRETYLGIRRILPQT